MGLRTLLHYVRSKLNRDSPRDRSEVLALCPIGGVVAEIGSWKGDFAAEIEASRAPSTLYVVDPWKFAGEFPHRLYGGSGAKSQADMDAIYEGVCRRFAANPNIRILRRPSLEAVKSIAADSLDWVYIDGDHSYQPALDDMRAWYPKVKHGGWLVCDDYYWVDESGRQSVRLASEAFLGELGPTTRAHPAPDGQLAIQRS